MTNKKRIQKLIKRKYKASRKVILFSQFKMGWDFAVQFRDDHIKDFPTPDWHKEYMNLPPTQPDVPGLRHYVRQLEKDLRNIPVYTAEFHRMAHRLRKAREDLTELIRERTEDFEKGNNFFMFPETPIRLPNITKHLF
ncbi:hypothetical protein [Chryseobacterium sp. NFX27]|uniref:hypothetical protein n=1 Tax=Chryseobacterium sp. NFX27 TaxID=2819618 RepID=UPI003CE7236E